MATSSAAIYLNLTREIGIFAHCDKRISRIYRIYICDNTRFAHKLCLNIETTENRCGMGNPPFRCARRRRQNMRNGNGPAIKQLVTGKSI